MAAGADLLGDDTRFIGSFRAHGLLVPVWDLAPGTEADAVAGPAAEYLVRLADALDVETMLLVALASGTLTAEQAQRQVGRATRGDDGKRRRSTPTRVEPAEVKANSRMMETFGDKVRISTTSYNRMVLLTGEVPTDADKATAERTVAQVPTGTSVVYRPGPPTDTSAWPLPDRESARTVQLPGAAKNR